MTVDGMPGTVEPNTTYPLTITVTPTAGSPVRAGFQLVAVNGTNANAGDLTASNAQSGTEFFGGREYLEQRGAKVFSGGSATWNFTWKSPVTAAGNTIKFYFIGNLVNNNNNDSGDYAISFSETYGFNGAPPVSASITSTSNLLCNGVNTGSATAEGGGGIAPYTYLWSNGQNTATAINLAAGTYTVTVTGASSTGTATATAVITAPPVLNATATASGVLNCINTSVTGTANATGGTGPYTYVWSNGTVGNVADLTTPGSNSVTATDANGCTKIASVNVTSNLTPPVATATPNATISCGQSTVQLSGAGSSTGTLYTYLWVASNGGNIVSGSTTLSPIVNAAGTYTLTVTNNNNGCTSTASTNVTSSAQPPTATASGTQLTCTNPSGTISVTTNASTPQFSWIGPGGFVSPLQNPIVTIPGTYTVVVTNMASGCSSTASATVTQNITAPSAAANGGTLNCLVTSLALNATSTTPGATYAWVGPNGYTSVLQNPTVTAEGTYTVTVQNPANGCTATATAAVISNTTAPVISATGGQLTCTVTNAQLNASSNAGTSIFGWTGPGGFVSTAQNPVVTVPGSYTLVVADNSNGCTASAVATVTQNITAPVASAITPGNLNCNTASIQLNGTGSSQGANFMYLWTTPTGNMVSGANTLTPTVNAVGTYNLIVTNQTNGCTSPTSTAVAQTPAVTAGISNTSNVSCNGGSNGALTATGGGGAGTYTYAWSSGVNTATASNLAAGTYIVSITDSENCTATATASVTQPDVLASNASATSVTSAGATDGTATAAPSGGTAPYSFVWSSGGTSATITGLAPGSYTVSVQDANACSAVQTVTVNSFNCTLAAGISASNVSCNGANNGSATVNVTGAAMPVVYAWSNGGSTPTVTGLAPGTFTVMVTDANNCPAELSVSITQPAPLLVNATATNQTGVGQNDGTASAQPTGGTASYTYLWSNMATTPSISGLAPATYTVIVADANGCTNTQSVVVAAFNCALSASVSSVNVSCAGGNNGQATAVPVAAALPVSYNWSSGSTTATANELSAGTYSVTLMDAVGCVFITTTTITAPAPLLASATNVTHVACPESMDGQATVEVAGGTAPYTVSWPNSSNGQNLGVGTYVFSVTDANACTVVNSVTINSMDTAPPQISCPSTSITACSGALVEYPLPAVSDNCSLAGAQAQLISGLPSGSVFPVGETVQVFQVSDVSGNSASCFFSVKVAPPIEITLDGITPDIGNTGVGTINISVGGGSGSGYTFEWKKDGQTFASSEDLSGLKAGVYTLVVTGPDGCTATLPSVTIDNTVATQEPADQLQVRVIPNPAFNRVRLEMSNTQAIAVQIINLRGQLVQTLEPTEVSSGIDVSTLPSGWYAFSIFTENGRHLLVKWLKAN
ncbi:MAG: T9SS type A sorting domain-containing protein [Saprospiraceae bacterium]|nr:T9SS type A sorting domain-containing protein [Saprospiraceae bacterium]